LQLSYLNIHILSIYRALTGDFKLFLNQLDTLLKSLYKTDIEFIVCGDMNTDYLIDSYNKKQLNTTLLSYNLTNTVQFPTRIQNNSKTAIDNIFIDVTKFGNYTVQPFYIDLSDHDAQIITINDILLQYQCNSIYKAQNFNTDSVSDFITRLSYETRGIVFGNYDVGAIFISFLDTHLKIIYCSFPVKIKQRKQTNITNPWISLGTEVSCRHKRELYITCRNSSDQNLINYYKMYCKILSNVITAAKKLYYNHLVLNSYNKTKTTWYIVKSVTDKKIY